MHHIVGCKRIARLSRLSCRFADGTQAEEDARCNVGVAYRLHTGDRERTKGQGVQPTWVLLEETRQIDAEVVQRKVSDRDATREIFEIDDGVLQLEQLL